MALTSNFNVVIGELEKDLKFLGTVGMTNLLNDISSSILKNNRERIHSKGKAVNGSLIGGGKYSQKQMLVGKKSFKTPAMASAFFSKKPKWKTLGTLSVAGTIVSEGTQSLAVVSEGYKEFRGLNGLKSDKVDLYFTGSLHNSFTYSKKSKQSFEIGFNSDKNMNKHDWLEKKYNQEIWGVGLEEQKDIDLLIDSYLNKL